MCVNTNIYMLRWDHPQFPGPKISHIVTSADEILDEFLASDRKRLPDLTMKVVEMTLEDVNALHEIDE